MSLRIPSEWGILELQHKVRDIVQQALYCKASSPGVARRHGTNNSNRRQLEQVRLVQLEAGAAMLGSPGILLTSHELEQL